VVVPVENLKEFDVVKYGREIRYHQMFSPSGTNVNFIKPVGEDTIEIRTYERGVEDETLACGTGSTAAAIIAYLKGLVKKKPVKVITKGGEVLTIDFDDKLEKVTLEGKVYKVFEGELFFEIFE
jgi:diaminopimelate epimerase